ncbi:MAG: hypothetical protein KDC98_13665, partial [Planctomycetes bacterium]|nr:hypothetical protein [Planctomycetota bacterium]
MKALTAIVLVATFCSGLRAQNCPPFIPQDQSPPNTIHNGTCAPSTRWKTGTPIELLDMWHNSPMPGQWTAFSRGIAFQANAKDVDEHVLICTFDADKKEFPGPFSADLVQYTYTSTGELPNRGEWRGLGQSGQAWQYAAGIYYLDPDTPPGLYKQTFRCVIDDLATEQDDKPIIYTVVMKIEVEDCHYKIEILSTDTDQEANDPGYSSTGSNCCAGGSQWAAVTAIRPAGQCLGVVPQQVLAEDLAVFQSQFLDNDQLLRVCDDSSQCPHGPLGIISDLLTNRDDLRYEWQVTNLTNPGNNGAMILGSGPETMLWRAPDLPNGTPEQFEVCIIVNDRGDQGFDDFYRDVVTRDL